MELADSLLREYEMTYLGTLRNNRKGLPADFKKTEGRDEHDYIVLYDVTGKKSIHSWITNTKSGTLRCTVCVTYHTLAFALFSVPQHEIQFGCYLKQFVQRADLYLRVGAKNVMLLTTTTPILGKTWDDNSFKPAIYKRYDYR